MPIQRRIGQHKNRIVAAVGLIAVLAACGAPTSNQPAGESTGDVPDKPSKAVTLNILLPGGPTDTGMIPPGVPGEVRATFLDPAIMGPPIVWLAGARVHGERIVATEFAAAT